MFHTPRHKTADELLRAVGFVPCKKATDRGYEIVLGNRIERKDCIVKFVKNDIERLHALAYHGFISIHADRNEGNQHKTDASHKLVVQKIQQIKKLDVQESVEISDISGAKELDTLLSL